MTQAPSLMRSARRSPAVPIRNCGAAFTKAAAELRWSVEQRRLLELYDNLNG